MNFELILYIDSACLPYVDVVLAVDAVDAVDSVLAVLAVSVLPLVAAVDSVAALLFPLDVVLPPLAEVVWPPVSPLLFPVLPLPENTREIIVFKQY